MLHARLMTAQIIDGKALSAKVKAGLKAEVAALKAKYGRAPGIAVVRVGEDPASKVYVTSKEKTALELGFAFSGTTTSRTPSRRPSCSRWSKKLNADDAVDGILVQLPLPKHIDSTTVLEAIDPAKDVDGFHAVNAGHLFQGRPDAGGLHALRRDAHARGDRLQRRGQELRGGRPQQHRGPPDGDAAAQRQRHRDHLPLARATWPPR